MKKKNKSNAKSEKRRERTSEDMALNRQIGSFGLEPPKIYRNNSGGSLDSFNRPSKRNGERREVRRPEPRTPQERVSKQNADRKKSKLKRKIIFYFAVALSIAALVLVLSLTVLFKIHTITITGNQVYNQKEIITVLPISENENLFLTNTKSAEKKLEESLPYIYNAEIKRKLPSTVVVKITETPKVYCVNNGDKTYTYLDDTFKVLETNGAKMPTGGIEIKKAKLTSKILGQKAEFENKKIKENLQTLASAVSKLNIDKITAIYSDDINNNYIEYDKRIKIKLGTLDNLDKKIYAAMSAIDKLNGSNPNAKGTITATNDKQIYFTTKM